MPAASAPLAGRLAPVDRRRGDEPGARSRVLIVDHEPQWFREMLKVAAPPATHSVDVARSGEDALRQIAADPPEIIVLDLRLPDQPGLEVMRRIQQIDARIPIVVATTAHSADTAIEAMRNGAYDYLNKPIHADELSQVIADALKISRLMHEPPVVATPRVELDGRQGVIGACPAILDVYKAIGRVASQTFPVLITGESGTGKELVARAIYEHGPRSGAPFLALNCAAIPEQLLESELFGHERGAFTGAEKRRIGKFEQCHGGTIFLDEIGDMPLVTQAKVLRLIQEQAFERVGGNETIKTDVRIIAATHRDLRKWSAEDRFRRDLYYRIGVFTIPLPPLRERGDDLPLLVQHYIRRFNRELGREIRELAPETAEILTSYKWPGNIRELQNVLRQAMLRATGSVLLPGFLPTLGEDEIDLPGNETGDANPNCLVVRQAIERSGRDLYARLHRELDSMLLPRVLKRAGGSQQQAALMLGIARQTLRLKLRDLGLPTSMFLDQPAAEPAEEVAAV